MTGPTLVISNPPHGKNVNLGAAAPLLELKPEDLRLKSMYGVPEIWMAESKPAQAKGYARAFNLSGLRLAIVDAAWLVGIPPRTLVSRFEFTSAGFEAETAGGAITLSYDKRVIGVYCTVQEPDQVPPFLDLYAEHQGELVRLTVEQGGTDLRGLLAERRIGVVANMPTLLSSCQRHFANLTLDRRLEKLRLRRRTGLPVEIAEKRRGYSYATSQLSELLESLEPGLGDVSQPELSSRLVYLTYIGEQP